MLTPGDPAPAFSGTDHTGKPVSLNDYRGKNLVLWFFPKADTPGCTAEGCGFRDHRAAFQEKNAEILGVSFDTAEENAAFVKKFDFNFPLLCDTSRAVGVAYGAADDASAKNAKRIGVIVGADGKVRHWFPKVDARAFPEEALKLL
ncbi:MAG: peroxiredoxin [Myxococcota bacterium]|nr:peroxiredoxin [Myxococcota bacterium]